MGGHVIASWFAAIVLMFSIAYAGASEIRIGFLSQDRPTPLPIGPLDEVARDVGLAGARLGISDNQTTGQFTGQNFSLAEIDLPAGSDPAPAIEHFAAEEVGFVVADLDPATLVAAADAASAHGIVVLNSGAPDDALRNQDCRSNLLHTIPSRAMLADGLAQYLVWKRWSRWLLVFGSGEGDQLLATAFRRAATRFGAEIVDEKEWTFVPGHGRTDTGHVTLQNEIPTFATGPEHDVLIVADEADVFGAYLEGRVASPRPVAGTHGLIVTGWSRVAEQWGATQLQGRFHQLAGRWMRAGDYAAWLAVRSVGEAAVRTGSADPETIANFMRSPEFLVAGFKGQGLTFRAWDGQMRQPVLIVGSRLLVSVSPQPGFLHPDSDLDTLGTDLSDTECAF